MNPSIDSSAAPAPTLVAPRGGRRLLALLVGLFMLPFGLGAALYAFEWHPPSGGPAGELVTGQPPLDGLLGPGGAALPRSTLGGRWTLAVLAADCQAACRDQLDRVRRLHVALGKQMPRLTRLALLADPARDAGALAAIWPDLVVAGSAAAYWRRQLAALPAEQVRVYVFDPEGRPVLRYPAAFDDAVARRALRDLERLLKYSWIG